MDVISAKPFIVHKGVGAGFFYALKNGSEGLTSSGSATISRMMRGMNIEISWEYPLRGLVPQLLLCCDCKLGCFSEAGKEYLSIDCVHGTWSGYSPKVAAKVAAARKLGIDDLYSCKVCGRWFRSKAIWWAGGGKEPLPRQRFYNDLIICGSKCRERASRWTFGRR